jgi:putative chitinase
MALGPAFSSDRQAFGMPNITSEQDARWNEWRTRYREISPEDLRAAGARGVEAATFAVPLNYAMKKFDISNTARQAAFLANVAVETGDPLSKRAIMLRSIEESAVPWTVNKIREKMPRHFPNDQAVKAVLKRSSDINHRDLTDVADPVKFFIQAYGDRFDELGNRPGTDDGYTYRGRGVLGLTGRARYTACSIALGVDFVGNPDLVGQLFYGCLAGAWAWCEVAFNRAGEGQRPRNLNLIADLDTPQAFDKTCAGVNHGDVDALRRGIVIHGLQLRQFYWPKFRHALHQRDLRLFHTRMAGVSARANLFDDFKRPMAHDDGMRPQFQRHAKRPH